MRGRWIVLAAGLLALAFFLAGRLSSRRPDPVTIGYFHGGRTNLFFRAYVAGEFQRHGVDVALSTRNLYHGEYKVIPRSWDEVVGYMDEVKTDRYGKVTGVEILRQIEAGRLDGGMVGESSFLQEIARGSPAVAVAALGHDTREMPGHCIIFRRDVKVSGPEDMKGLVLSSRRAGPGDEVMLREFLVQNGLDPDRDVELRDGVSDDLQVEGLVDGTFDGGYFHLMSVTKLVEAGHAYVYRPLDWVPADLSVAFLVFHRDFVAAHEDEIDKMLQVYIRRIDYEYQIPTERRVKSQRKGMQLAEDFLGMNYPQCDIPPVVRLDLLEQMQQLLIKHRFLSRATRLEDFVDNRLVLRATRAAGFPTDGSYQERLP